MHAWFVLVLIGCSGGTGRPTSPTSPAPATPAPTAEASAPAEPAIGMVEPECAPYVYYSLNHALPGSHTNEEAFMAANSAAHADVHAATAAADARDHHAAAKRFLSCALRYRPIPDASTLIETARKNAASCYKNAVYAYVNAGRFASEGRALLEQAALDDPRMAALIKEQLATAPSDCATPGR